MNNWDFTVCMYMLCYFNAADQTRAVRNMCLATRREVLLFNGLGNVPTVRLVYDQAAITGLGWTINVLDDKTHHLTK